MPDTLPFFFMMSILFSHALCDSLDRGINALPNFLFISVSGEKSSEKLEQDMQIGQQHPGHS